MGFMLLVPPEQISASMPPASSMAATSMASSSCRAAFHAVGEADLAEDGKLVSHGVAHCLEYTQGQAHTVRQPAPVLVGAPVGLRADELAEPVAVAEVNLRGVKARLLHQPGGVAIGLHEVVDVGQCHRSREGQAGGGAEHIELARGTQGSFQALQPAVLGKIAAVGHLSRDRDLRGRFFQFGVHVGQPVADTVVQPHHLVVDAPRPPRWCSNRWWSSRCRRRRRPGGIPAAPCRGRRPGSCPRRWRP